MLAARHEELSEETLDAETLWALDRLLEDPVDLNRGALTRLLALPWLSSAHLDAIRGARPLPDVASLARLPGWDAALVRRVAPFVHVGSRRAAWVGSLRARLVGTQPLLALGAEWGAIQVGLRSERDSLALDGGFVRVDARGLRFVAGDVAVAHGQGMLWWNGASSVRATSAPLRRPRGILGLEGSGGTHTVRGAAAAIAAGRFRIAGAAGDGRAGHVRGGVGSLALGHGQTFHFGFLQVARSQWYGGGWSVDGATTRAAVEIVPCRGDPALAVAAEVRRGRARLGVRWQRTPSTPLAPLAGITAAERGRDSRQVLLHGVVRWAAATWELGLARGARHDSLGGRTTQAEQRLSARWSWPAQSLEVRLRQRRTQAQALEIESITEMSVERSRGAVVRYVRALGGGTSLAADYRAEERVESSGVASGSAWQLQVAHAFRGLEVQAAFTSFAAPVATAAPVVPTPGGGLGGASLRLVGDGVHATAAVRLRLGVLDCSVRAGRSIGAAAAREPEWRASVGLQLP